jgi:hypothetical protein
MKEPINRITLKDGTIRYRLVVDTGRDENGRRKQLTRTFDTKREARDELSVNVRSRDMLYRLFSGHA